MRYFVCLVDSGERGSGTTRRHYEALPLARGLNFAWYTGGHVAVLTAWDDPWGDPLVTQDGEHLAVGVVRLDNRSEVQRWTDTAGLPLTDLQLVARLVTRTRTTRIRDLLGDFAFVVWNEATRSAIAATDALGVRRLFYSHGAVTAFASRAEALALADRYDQQYLAERVAVCVLTPGITPYEGVRQMPAGTIGTLRNAKLSLDTYWSPEEFGPTPHTPGLEREAPQALRALLTASVRQRLSPDGNTWAQLSGGLDSSSVVSMAQWLAAKGEVSGGIAGTITYVDWQDGYSDEREYVRAVAKRWQVRNEAIVDPPFWFDPEAAPPYLDLPRDFLAFYPREHRLCQMVRHAGGRVLLTGFGSDELFTGSTIFFADWLARGHIGRVARELARWAALGRVSFWELAYGNALLPLIPRGLQLLQSSLKEQPVPWLSNIVARRYGLLERAHAVTGNFGRLGGKYRDALLQLVTATSTQLDAGLIGDVLDVRYPFLARPLVEFALRLPPELCAQPHARKWVLREAIRDIVPETVRTRVGKGAPTDLLMRSLTSQRVQLEALVEGSMLAELGVVDARRLRAAFDTVPAMPDGDRSLATEVQSTLITEAWLRIRAGRWPPGPSCS